MEKKQEEQDSWAMWKGCADDKNRIDLNFTFQSSRDKQPKTVDEKPKKSKREDDLLTEEFFEGELQT